MDLNTILSEVRDWCDDEDIELDEVVKWTNRCLEKLAGQFGEEFSADAVIDPVIKEYKWGNQFLEVNRVELHTDEGKFVRVLNLISFDNVKQVTGGMDSITSYYELGRSLGIYPYPEAGVAGKIIVYGKKRFVPVVDGNSIPEFGPEIYHDAIVYYCCMRYFKRDQENEEFSVFKTLYEERLYQRRLEVDEGGSGSGNGFQVKRIW